MPETRVVAKIYATKNVVEFVMKYHPRMEVSYDQAAIVLCIPQGGEPPQLFARIMVDHSLERN